MDENELINENKYINYKITEKELPNYMKLYPPIIDDSDLELSNNILKRNSKVNFKKIIFEEYNNELKNDNSYEINDKFFESLLKKKNPFERRKTINTISKLIHNSKLVEKFESEYNSDKKLDLEILIHTCVRNLNYMKLNKGEILFKIGQLGDRFYFILSGKINILKLKELDDIYLTNIEYLQYCKFLIDKKEEYILNKVIKKNKEFLDITYPGDIILLYRIYFKKILEENILQNFIQNNAQLKDFFDSYYQSMKDLNIEMNDLLDLEEQKLNGVYSSIKKWKDYILKRCVSSLKENILFKEYKEILKDTSKKNIICYIYESFLLLGPGLFFGDFALDSANNRRNATIRAEKDTILAWLKNTDYANIISPKRKIEKYNEVMFLYKNFFFNNSNFHTFENDYFHLFPPHEFKKGSILINSGTIPKSIFFIQEGQFSLELKCSIFDIHFLIRNIFENLMKNKYYKKLSKLKTKNLIEEDVMIRIKKYLNEPIFYKIKNKPQNFKEELMKKRKYILSFLIEKQMIGIEEIFLGIPYICNGEVTSEKLVSYELTVKQLKIFLENDQNILNSYIKLSIEKIITLLDRLQNIKKNGIFIAKLKYDDINDKNNKDNINNILINQKDNSILEYTENNSLYTNNINLLPKKTILNLQSLIKDRSINKNNKINDIKKINLNFLIKNKFKNNRAILNNIKKIKQRNSTSKIMTSSNEINKNNISIKNYRNYNKYKILSNKLAYNNKNMLMIGNKCIKIHNIKKQLNKCFSLDKNMNNFSIKKINLNDNKNFDLSYIQYPLSEEQRKSHLDENNDSNNFNNIKSYNYSNISKKMNLYESKSFNNSKNNLSNININYSNNLLKIEKNIFSKKLKPHSLKNIFIKKIIENSNLNSLENSNRVNLVNFTLEQPIRKRKIVQTKELISDIIKDYYKKIKFNKNFSFFHKISSNSCRQIKNKYN